MSSDIQPTHTAATGVYPCCGAICQKRQPTRPQSGCTTQPHTPAEPPKDPPQAFAPRPASGDGHAQARVVRLLMQHQHLCVQLPSTRAGHGSQQLQSTVSESRHQQIQEPNDHNAVEVCACPRQLIKACILNQNRSAA